MAANFEVFNGDEEQIFKQLDNDLFYNDIERQELAIYDTIEPVSQLDIVVQAAVRRALDITVPSGWSGTMNRKRINKI